MASSKTTGAIGGAGQGAAIGTSIMPGWGTAIGAVVGGIGGLLSGGGEDEAEELAEMQSQLILRTSRENQRRKKLEMRQTLGRAEAATYASGLQDTGTTRRYRKQLESQYRADMSWEYNKALTESNMARKGGQIAANTIQNQGLQSAISGIGAAAGAAADAGVFSSKERNIS